MFEALTNQLQGAFSNLMGKKKLTEETIAEAVNEVRLALLEADVSFAVVKALIKRIKEQALGELLIKSVTPGQQFIKIVHDELVALMGGLEATLNLVGTPPVLMLCGLQGSGKTTHCAKLAKYLKKQGQCKRPLLIACDLQRPAAIQQLQILAEQVGCEVFTLPSVQDPIRVAQEGLKYAREAGFDLVIADTAGRLHVDDQLMTQLEQVRAVLKPSEILFVANATTGQDAITVATEFNRRIEITGVILTMLDGNTRGGAAISIREATGKPLKFEGVGEKLDDLQLFNPKSMADRVLGMGDTINLVKKAQEHFSESDAKQLEQKLRSASFTYDDYVKQIQSVKKMGSIKSLLGMLPGMGQLPLGDFDEKEFFRVEAIILSMTFTERAEGCELTPSRRKRLAEGSGTKIEDVNKLVKSFKQAKQFFKNMPNMKQLEKMLGGSLWR